MRRGTADVPLQSGRMFVVSGAPNPFRTHMDVSFSLPKARQAHGADAGGGLGSRAFRAARSPAAR